MRIVSNIGTDRVIDVLVPGMAAGAEASIASPWFSLFAFEALRPRLDGLSACRLILPAPDNHDLGLMGVAADRFARNRLQARWLARACAQWLARKAVVRFASRPLPQGVMVISGGMDGQQQAVIGDCSLSSEGLGLAPNESLGITQFTDDEGVVTAFLGWFESIWRALPPSSTSSPFFQRLDEIAGHRAPSLIYFQILYQIFRDLGDELDEERIVKSATGIRDTVVWKKLFRFQRDGVFGAIEKLERIGGCIIADSVGLGKTFEALAVIKYYELRNDRVLVLCPKRLRDNGRSTSKRHRILAADRLNYDVLNHTDLSRDGGMSGDIDLAHVNRATTTWWSSTSPQLGTSRHTRIGIPVTTT